MLLVSFLLVCLVVMTLCSDCVCPFITLFTVPITTVKTFLTLGLSLDGLDLFTLLNLVVLVKLMAGGSVLVISFAGRLGTRKGRCGRTLVATKGRHVQPVLVAALSVTVKVLPVTLTDKATTR